MESFAQRLRRLREEQGFSIASVANSCNTTTSTIRALETGSVKNPAFTLGLALSVVLHVDPFFLALGSAGPTMQLIEELRAGSAALDTRIETLVARVERIERDTAGARRRR